MAEYIGFNLTDENLFLAEIIEAVREVKAIKAYDIKFMDIFEHIKDTWQLTEAKRKSMKAQSLENYQESVERSYK